MWLSARHLGSTKVEPFSFIADQPTTRLTPILCRLVYHLFTCWAQTAPLSRIRVAYLYGVSLYTLVIVVQLSDKHCIAQLPCTMVVCLWCIPVQVCNHGLLVGHVHCTSTVYYACVSMILVTMVLLVGHPLLLEILRAVGVSFLPKAWLIACQPIIAVPGR